MQSEMISVRVQGRDVVVPYGATAGEILKQHATITDSGPLLAAIVHNRCVDLDVRVTAPTEVHPVDYARRSGVMAYRRSASLILLEAMRQLFPGVRVRIGQAIGNGYHYRIYREAPLSSDEITQVEAKMRQIVADDEPLLRQRVSVAAARQIFTDLGAEDKLRLLRTYWESHVPLVHCGGFCDIHHYPVAPSAGLIQTFSVLPDRLGLILRFPPRGHAQTMLPFEDSPKLVTVYEETWEWLNLLGLHSVGKLNELLLGGEAGEIIQVAEGLHEKKIAHIADQILRRTKNNHHGVRLILIAGPSSSGKTTFSKRLGLQLKVNGLHPVTLSTDNFYVDRERTPKDEHGNYDFEALEAIDLALFNTTLASLLSGHQTLTPRFDFTQGVRRPKDKWHPMQLLPGQILVVEGIHGLNPRLTAAVSDAQKFRIYINALTQLCLDDHNRLFTSDTRLLRRIVRDRLYRGYSAEQTITNWPSVRRGEIHNIYKFQEHADAMFNSALVYEHAVLRLYAGRFLLEVPQEHPSFVNAYRLLRYVNNYLPIFNETIPATSILREFIGGSFFQY